LLGAPSLVMIGCELIRNATSDDDGDDQDTQIGSISRCHAMMSQLMVLRLMGWQAMVGKALAPSLSVVGVLFVMSVEVAGGHG